ncbi:biotin transporter BioY [Anaeromicropila populeti]|uniref:Biotin transporter n=1 Tax=Anaeromicropila populeti TaxID=37658 RepID=A0A1I6IRD2_9FIRM|nr:biotin transporter BioY [Anaeromicropila populeti]SFR69312.1 biotin transport system substrate-specific component [Anaeromicropila populeti]
MKKMSIKNIVLCGMFAAILAVMAQVSIPLPSGVPVTLQTLGMALCGYILGWKYGMVSNLVYILAGVIGIPVFANFRGGVQVLFGKTGGFLIGFVVLTVFCGIAVQMKNKVFTAIFSLAGLIICHMFGVLQFAFLMKLSIPYSITLVSVPFLVKDIISIGIAYFVALAIRQGLTKSGVYQFN